MVWSTVSRPFIQTDTREEAVEWATRYREMIGMPELRMSEIQM